MKGYSRAVDASVCVFVRQAGSNSDAMLAAWCTVAIYLATRVLFAKDTSHACPGDDNKRPLFPDICAFMLPPSIAVTQRSCWMLVYRE